MYDNKKRRAAYATYSEGGNKKETALQITFFVFANEIIPFPHMDCPNQKRFDVLIQRHVIKSDNQVPKRQHQ